MFWKAAFIQGSFFYIRIMVNVCNYNLKAFLEKGFSHLGIIRPYLICCLNVITAIFAAYFGPR